MRSPTLGEPGRGRGSKAWSLTSTRAAPELAGALVTATENAARRWDGLAVEATSLHARSGVRAFCEWMGYEDICGRSGRFLKTLA